MTPLSSSKSRGFGGGAHRCCQRGPGWHISRLPISYSNSRGFGGRAHRCCQRGPGWHISRLPISYSKSRGLGGGPTVAVSGDQVADGGAVNGGGDAGVGVDAAEGVDEVGDVLGDHGRGHAVGCTPTQGQASLKGSQHTCGTLLMRSSLSALSLLLNKLSAYAQHAFSTPRATPLT